MPITSAERPGRVSIRLTALLVIAAASAGAFAVRLAGEHAAGQSLLPSWEAIHEQRGDPVTRARRAEIDATSHARTLSLSPFVLSDDRAKPIDSDERCALQIRGIAQEVVVSGGFAATTARLVGFADPGSSVEPSSRSVEVGESVSLDDFVVRGKGAVFLEVEGQQLELLRFDGFATSCPTPTLTLRDVSVKVIRGD